MCKINETCCHFAPPIELRFTNLFKRTTIQMALYGHLTTSHPHQQTNFPKLSLRFSISPRLCVKLLPFAFADMLMAELLRCSIQTESKGNFCLITVYSHKTKFRG
jgi:hypothetical protein